MLDHLNVVNWEELILLSMFLLVSRTFISSRWQARKYWSDIKKARAIALKTRNKDTKIQSLSEFAADRRYAIAGTVRCYENHKQFVTIIVFYSVVNIIETLVNINNHLMY